MSYIVPDPSLLPTPRATGRWVYQEFRRCAICLEPTETPAVEFSYGSEHDGDILCGPCCRAYVDPAVKRVLPMENKP